MPDLAAGDVHVHAGTIVAVAPVIEASAAQVIDGAGMICIPGFVDTHFHLWNALFRVFVRADVPALSYFPVTARLGPLMEPEDSYRSVRLGAAEALAAGVTTVHNWSHNTRSPEHADAELSGMRDIGIRGRFSYGTPVGMADDAPMDFAGLARVKADGVTKRLEDPKLVEVVGCFLDLRLPCRTQPFEFAHDDGLPSSRYSTTRKFHLRSAAFKSARTALIGSPHFGVGMTLTRKVGGSGRGFMAAPTTR